MKKKIVLLSLIGIIILFGGIWIGLRTFVYPIKYFDIIRQECLKNHLDPYLILAIIKSESGFNQNATSNKNAKGLMQLMDSTAQEVNEKENNEESLEEDSIYDVELNISLGCKYFASLIQKYNGNYYLAICAYNAGMGNVDKWIEEGIIPDDLEEYKEVDLPFNATSKYLQKVVTSYKAYRILY